MSGGHIQVLLLCGVGYVPNQTILHLVAQETRTEKTQVISLCKCQHYCLKGWQDLNIRGVLLVNHYAFSLEKKKEGCAWQSLPQMHSNPFILKWIPKLKFQLYCLKKKVYNEQKNNGIQNSWHKARDLSIFQVDLSNLGKEE